MKQVTLEFHPASERPEPLRDLVVIDDREAWFPGSYYDEGVFWCRLQFETWTEEYKIKQVRSWAYLPNAKECVE